MGTPSTTIWRTEISSSLTIFLFATVLFQAVNLSDGQHFNSSMDDKTYLNHLEKEIEVEVNQSKTTFYKQAQLLDNVARQFVAAQLKENLFIALRVLAEKELEELKRKEENGESVVNRTTTESPLVSPTTTAPHNRTKRQDDGDEDGDDGDGAAGGAAGAGGVALRPTIPPQIGLLPQVANLIRVVFGGNGQLSQVNLTMYVASASKLLPRPVGNQVLGLVKILTNAQGNPNRNSFTTPNPLLAGQLPADLNLKSPALAGLTQEQLLALTLAQNGGLNGLSPELLNSLGINLNGLQGILAAAAANPAGGAGAGGANGANGIGGADAGGAGAGAAGALPGGLTEVELAYLAALGVPGVPNIATSPAPQRSTRKPRPNYGSHNKPTNQENNNSNNNFQQQFQPQTTSSQPILEEPLFAAPTPSPVFNIQSRPRPSYNVPNPNPQFSQSDKDLLPLNLNPNKQTLSEIQQHLLALNLPKYQEAPQSALQPPSVFGTKNNLPIPIDNTGLHQNAAQSQLNQQINHQLNQYTQSILNAQPGLAGALGQLNQQQLHQQHINQQLNQQLINQQQLNQQQLNQQQLNQQQLNQQQLNQQQVHQQLNLYNQNNQNLQQSNNFNAEAVQGQNENNAVNQANAQNTGAQPQPQQQQTSGNKNRRPLTPVEQEQAKLQAEQLQYLLEQEKQKLQEQTATKQVFQSQQIQSLVQQNLLTPQQAQYLQQLQSNQKPSFQNEGQSQYQISKQPGLAQQQSGLGQQQSGLGQQQSGLGQQQSGLGQHQSGLGQQQSGPFQSQQKFQQQLLQQPRRPSPPPNNNNIDEEDSEEDDSDFRARARQLNILQNIFPAILGGINRNNNNNNNQNNNNNNNNQNNNNYNNNNNNNNNNGQQLQNNVSQPGNQGNGTVSPNDPNGNNNNNNGNNNNNQNQSNGFDLQMFAMNLGRGISDVVRVMPDLFRGAREGLQLIQALSSILRAFPGLADALPI